MFKGRRKIKELEYRLEKQERRMDVLAEVLQELRRQLEAMEAALEARGPEAGALSDEERRETEELRRQWGNFWAYNGAEQKGRGE